MSLVYSSPEDQQPVFSHHLQWYAILEGAHPDHDPHRLIHQTLDNPQWLALYDVDAYRPLAAASPVLVGLPDPSHWLAQWRQSFPGLAGTLVGAKTSLAEVGDHLRTLISVRVEGGADALFRFHDSWILSALYPALDEAERSKLHGPIEQWVWVLRDRLEQGVFDREGAQGMTPPLQDGWLLLDKARQQVVYQGCLARRQKHEQDKDA